MWKLLGENEVAEYRDIWLDLDETDNPQVITGTGEKQPLSAALGHQHVFAWQPKVALSEAQGLKRT